MRRKLCNLVIFLIEGLDLSRIVVKNNWNKKQLQNGFINENTEEYFIEEVTQDYNISQESQGSI